MNTNTICRIKENFNLDWKFKLDNVNGAENIDCTDSAWENVNLPHTPRVEDVNVCSHFQGICWYRKWFHIDSQCENKKIFIEFEAAMQVADVWINGKHKLTHIGGYLPFTIDITDDVIVNGDNVIAIKLDNRDNGDIPPGKPAERLDFCYFGGIYRNVYMHITDKLHITDAVYADKTADGGVFITYTQVSDDAAEVNIKTNVKNESVFNKETKLVTTILDEDDKVIKTEESSAINIPQGEEYTFNHHMIVEKPKLWHPDRPYLYNIHIFVVDGEIKVDEVKIRAGIRHISCKKPEGFILNGEPIKLRGANRHQQYPYIGIAASDNAQFRDAKKLKDAGFNFLRLAHYPQSPAFLDACDELGIMVVEPIPGWQWCKEGQFQEVVIQNIRDMIRRDRNHPCAVMWEVSLNETGTYWSGASDAFYNKCNKVAHEEYPGSQMFTSGDTLGRKNPAEANFDIPHTEWDEEEKTRPLKSLPEKMGLDREYGDYEFGGHYSTTRQFRSDGEKAMLQQAWNFQWSHNRNLGNKDSLGDAIWVGIDYNRSCSPDKPICNCGILDTFRLPKYAYYFYQSQRRNDIENGQMVYIANNWTPSSPEKLVVYSNCDEISLYLNGRLIEKRKPDNGPDLEWVEKVSEATVDYWIGSDLTQKDASSEEELDPLAKLTSETSFDGGSCKRLQHAPFTFDKIAYEPGELKAVGLINGKEAAWDLRRTPGKPTAIKLEFDISGKELLADGADFVFVYAHVVDDNGTTVPDASNEIVFSIGGAGDLIGTNQVRAEAGIATVLLKSQTEAGRIVVTAEGGGLRKSSAEIVTK